MLQRALFVFAFLAALSSAPRAADYRANVLFNITLCDDSEIWLTTLELLRGGDGAGAHQLIMAAVRSGRCARFPIVNYQPEAVVQKWVEDDGTGTPGVVVAGHILLQDGSRGQRAFIWITPELLKEYFALAGSET